MNAITGTETGIVRRCCYHKKNTGVPALFLFGRWVPVHEYELHNLVVADNQANITDGVCPECKEIALWELRQGKAA